MEHSRKNSSQCENSAQVIGHPLGDFAFQEVIYSGMFLSREKKKGMIKFEQLQVIYS